MPSKLKRTHLQRRNRPSWLADLPPRYQFFLLIALIVLIGFAIWNHTINGDTLNLFITYLLR